MRSVVIVAIAGLLLGLTATVHAQESFAGTIDRTTNECVLREPGCTSDEGCAVSSGEEASVCTSITVGGMAQAVCRPATSAFCCTVDHGIVCPDGRRCVFGATGEVGLCVRESDEYCGVIGETAQLLACHTSPAGDIPVAYEQGDCDRDGVRNGAERMAMTSICAAPEGSYGVIVGDGAGGAACLASVTTCEELDRPCTFEGDARARCVANERTGGAAPLCSVAPDVFCCGGLQGLQCPAGECVLPADVDDAFGVCTDATLLCPDRSEAGLIRCHRGIDGRGPVVVEDGDCDQDGVTNAREVELGRNHCVADAAPDAGSVSDGGAPPGASLEVSFGGGGGCRCAMGARDSSERSIGLSILIGLLFAVRRRAR